MKILWNVRLSVNSLILAACVLMLSSAGSVWADRSSDPDSAGQNTLGLALRHGQEIYRRGILPSGQEVISFVNGDTPVSGSAFTCESCHMRSGLGSVEGGVFTTPTTGKVLFQPRTASAKKGPVVLDMMGGGAALPPPDRPAYTDESLAEVIRSGVDSSGRALSSAMPRYALQGSDMTALVSYLKALSSEYSPGVDNQTLRFATVITDDAPETDASVMYALLESFFAKVNAQTVAPEAAQVKPRRMKQYMFTPGKSSSRTLSLSLWKLHGPSETWRSQLEDYYRREPVFALIGGISNDEWRPVHEFSEKHKVPCLFPATGFPVISETDWYTLYLSKGFYQEGEGAARFLNGRPEITGDSPVVQIIRNTRKGRILAEGFQKTWTELGHGKAFSVTLKEGESISPDALKSLLTDKKPVALLVWDGDESLSAAMEGVSAAERPALIMVSSGYMEERIRLLPEKLREITFITYPYRLPQDEKRYESYIDRLSKDLKVQDDDRIIVKQTNVAISVLNQALIEMKDNFYRDYLLDVISMIRDLDFPLYERLSFGPGQRYASKGCYIVQLAKGETPELIQKSSWVVH